MKSKPKNNEKKTWVEVEVNKFTDRLTVFRGQMLKTDLEAWSRGEMADCAIKLENAYWFLEDTVFILGQGDETVRHYTGDIYLRSDTVMLIFTLREDSFPNQTLAHQDNIFLFPGRSK